MGVGHVHSEHHNVTRTGLFSPPPKAGPVLFIWNRSQWITSPRRRPTRRARLPYATLGVVYPESPKLSEVKIERLVDLASDATSQRTALWASTRRCGGKGFTKVQWW